MKTTFKHFCAFYFSCTALALGAVVVQAEDEAGAKEDAGPIWQGETEQVRFSVQEGTWLNIDVSPDGERLVFDLLGDLYLLPVEGGKAVRLTTTTAQEVQPRFSPDGQILAFISDENGGNNIHLMSLASLERRALTEETFRLLSNPRWHPSGTGIVARKHFTGTRSLGSGEMWLYHLEGGTGVALTDKRNDQQDENDPVYSPDGRYLFYSQDATTGPYFRYNKNPYEGIYVTRRLDLNTGENIALLGGPGGAVRPEPSPDGRYLAYVKRIQTDTALMLYDRTTGRHELLSSKLDHDQQEVWAVFGLYPNFAWTPTSDALFFWAGGGIHRLDLATREVKEIPFEAEVDVQLAKAQKAKPQLATSEINVKMMRDWSTVPDGSATVFHALGHLYTTRLDEPVPQRLTDFDGFEYSPSFSKDGRWLTYVQWSDAGYGHVMRARWRNSGSRLKIETVTSAPGHYQNPAVSDNGDVVYEKLSGNGFRGYHHGLEPGLYLYSESDGSARRIVREARSPQFIESDSRIAYEYGGGDKRILASVGRSGEQQRDHYQLGRVSEWAIEPAGLRIAYREDFKVYVSPMVTSAKIQPLSHSDTALPSTQVSDSAGRYLHWSDIGLHWGLGSQYFSLALKGPDPEAVAQQIPLTEARDYGTDLLAYENARIITMAGAPIEQGTLLVQGNKIVAVGPKETVSVPASARRFDLSGKTIIPGLIDTHAHHSGHFYSSPLPQTNASYLANLAFGVTTTHDPSSNTETVFSLSELQRTGRLIGPRVLSTGAVLYGAKSNSFVDIQSLDDARLHLSRLKEQGAFSVKSYNQPRRDQRQYVMQAAAELGMSVYPEGGATFYNQLTHLIDGATGLEHNLPIAPLYEDVLSLWAAAPWVGYTPTLVVNYAGLNSEYYWYQASDVWHHELLGKYTPLAELTARSRRVEKAADDDFFFKTVAASAKDLQERGVLVTVGAHGQLQGLGYHWEMWSLALGGMSPEQVLQAATIDGARYLNVQDQVGSLEPGKLADFAVLGKNPLADIQHTDSVEQVSIDGVLYDSATMNAIAPVARDRGLLWFEREGGNVLWDANNWGMTRPEDDFPTCPAHQERHY